jgi:hypothetical protein
MKNIIVYLKDVVHDNILERLMFAAVFGMAFSVMGYYLPKTYLTYIDKTDYYKVYSPVAVNQSLPHYPCDPVEVSFTKESLINGKGTVEIALNLYKVDKVNNKNRVGYQQRTVPLTKGESVVTTNWDVSCTSTPGQYYFEGVLTYMLNGVEKSHSFYSEKFNIIAKPLQLPVNSIK